MSIYLEFAECPLGHPTPIRPAMLYREVEGPELSYEDVPFVVVACSECKRVYSFETEKLKERATLGKLPCTRIEGFRKILIEDSGTSGMVMDQLCKFVRAVTRRLGLERGTASEEFWRLAQEVGYVHAATNGTLPGGAGK